MTLLLDYGTSFDYEFTHEPLSINDWSRLLRAGRSAQMSTHRFKLGCIVTKAGKTLSVATNKRKTHPDLYPNRMSMHAEMCALKTAPVRKGTTVYVARLDKDNNFCMALSCLYCISFMLKEKVDRVVYTIDSNSASSFHLNTVASIHLGNLNG